MLRPATTGDAAINRRAYPRIPVSINAAIELRSGSSFACMIRDLSPGGARLEFAQADKLPKRFYLRILGAPSARVVLVQWRRAGEVGVRFADEQEASALVFV